MKLLITGGLGFMGSNFIRHLLKTYPAYQIVNLDKMTYAGNPANLKDAANNPRYRFIKGDIANATDVDSAIGEGVDAIINYAAETHVDRSILNPRAFVETDVLGTYALLEAVKRHNIARFIQISTDEVYGSIDTGHFNEESCFNPNSPYAASKAGGDHLVRAYFHTYQTPVIVTHSSNCYGPYQYPEKFIPLFITNLLENKTAPLYGDGLNVREWLYVEDHCRAIDHLLHNGQIGESYNIGSGEEKSNIEVARLLLSALGQNESKIEYVKDRLGHDRRYALDAAKLKVTGWQPQTSFNEALNKTIKWYQQNEAWWRPIKSGDFLAYYQKQYVNR